MNEKFYDFDERPDVNSIEPRYNRDDLLDEETNPVICDVCNDGIKLVAYLGQTLICPRCMHVYNPAFDAAIKHEAIETTIEDMQDTRSGTMAYVEDSKHDTAHTRIRKKIGTEAEIPEYVKREIEAIHWRKGYKTVPLDREKLSSTRTK